MGDLRTDEQAKQFACPLFRYLINEVEVLQNGATPIYVHSQCAGSACIAWRKSREDWESVPKSRLGYCGIAGRPE